MKTSHCKLLAVVAAILLPLTGLAQVNSGSDGHDGALNPAGNLVINMVGHPCCHVERQRNISDYFPFSTRHTQPAQK